MSLTWPRVDSIPLISLLVKQLLYNDQSPMENHHLSAAFLVARKEGSDFLGELPRKVCARSPLGFLRPRIQGG